MSKKGATQSGSAAGMRRVKDQARAAYMKERGIARTSGRCCICNGMISLSQLEKHITNHAFAGAGKKK